MNYLLFNSKKAEIYCAMAKVILTSKSSAMKSYLPLLSLILIFASCSTAYKTGQTPDDVYFSPERQRDEYVRVKESDDRMYRNDETAREERYLRMKTRDRRYGLLDDDYDCYCYTGGNYYRYNDYYRYNSGYYRGRWSVNPNIAWGWNPYYEYNPFAYSYNPYMYNPYYKNPYYSGNVSGYGVPVYNKPRTTNLHAYDNNGNNYNSNLPKSNGRTFNNSNANSDDNYRGSGTNAGGFLRNVFGSGNSSNSGSTQSPSSTSNSSSSSSGSSSSSSSGSGGGSAPVRKF